MAQRVAVVTGAGSGIGRALARELSRRGWRLAISDVDAAGLAGTAAGCAGVEVRSYALDVADHAAVDAHATQVVTDLGGVDLVVNNAGVALSGWARELSEGDFRWLMEINFWGVVAGTQAFLPHLIASGGGHVVNLSSVFGLVGMPKQAAYSASKFAVRGYTEALAMEMALAGLPVRVSCVHPGGVRTGIARSARLAASEDRDATVSLFDALARTSPERAAREILRGIHRGRPRIRVGPDAVVLEAMQRLLGARYQGPLARLLGRRVHDTETVARAAHHDPEASSP